MMMAQYRLLTDHYIAGRYLEAGTVITTGIAGVPANWAPTPEVDPLDTDAIQAFWNAGPRINLPAPSIIRSRWVGEIVAAPVVYWRAVGGGFYQLTGAGASLGTNPAM